MQIQANLDLIEVPQGELWEFSQVVPKDARFEVLFSFKDSDRASHWDFKAVELLAQWSEGSRLVARSATIDLTEVSRLIEALQELVDATPEEAIFEPIVAVYDPILQMPLEMLSPSHCTLVASWDQDPTVVLLDL